MQPRARTERRLAAQYAIVRVLAEAATLQDATPRLLRAVCETLGWEVGALWVVDTETDVLACIDAWCRSKTRAPEFIAVTKRTRFTRGIGLPGRVWERGRPAWIPDVVHDSNFPRAPFAARDNLHGAFAFPILLGTQVLGVIEFFSREIREPDDELLQMMAATGSQIGQFITRTRSQSAVRESEALKSSILSVALDCIITMDHHGNVVEFNTAAEETFGYKRDNVIGRRLAELIIPEPLRARHYAGLARYLETGIGPVIGKRIEMPALRADGTEFPVELAITRIPGEGPPVFTAYLRDITQRKRVDTTLRVLAEASTLPLAESLDYEGTLANIARLAVPTIADWCIVDLIDDQGALRQVGVAHRDPALEPMVRELRRRYPPAINPQHVILRVLRTGQAELTPEFTDADLRARARDDAHYELLRTVGIYSHLVVPLIARGRTLGVISFISGSSHRRYEAADLALAEELGARAAVAIDNAHLFGAERQARADAEDALRRVNATNRLIALAASALDLGQVFDEFGEVLRTLVPFVRVTVSLYAADTDSLTMPYFKGPHLSAPPERMEGPKTGTVRGWVIDHGKAFIRDDTFQIKQFSEDDILALAGIRSYVVVPMTAGRRVIGTLNFGHDTPGMYRAEHAQLAQPIADQLALTVSRFQLFEEVRRKAGELSTTLQRALLPAALPKPPFVAIAALYQPADPEARVGGDWYDALLMPDDRLLISLGDVAGHGVVAAAAMAQLRHLVRALAIQGRRPADVIAAINHYLMQLPDRTHLSVWIATLDPVSGDLVYGGAGHPPVIVQGENGKRELASQSPPVGFSASITYRDERVGLLPGERLIAYTDGLIEATRDPIEGERRLADAVAQTRDQPPERAVRSLVADVLRGTRQEDDIALLLVDLLPQQASLSFALPAVPENLRRVRHAIRIYAQRMGFAARRVEEIVAAVGEAALNIVEHAYRGETGDVAVDAHLRDGVLAVTVRDKGQWRPVIQRGGGRGKRLMEGFADSVDTTAGPTGTTVELRWKLAEPEVASE